MQADHQVSAAHRYRKDSNSAGEADTEDELFVRVRLDTLIANMCIVPYLVLLAASLAHSDHHPQCSTPQQRHHLHLQEQLLLLLPCQLPCVQTETFPDSCC